MGRHANDTESIPRAGLKQTIGSPQFISAAGLVCVGLSGLYVSSHVDLSAWSSLPAELATGTASIGAALSSFNGIDRYIPQMISAAAALIFAVGSIVNGNWLPAAASIFSALGRLAVGNFYYENRKPALAPG